MTEEKTTKTDTVVKENPTVDNDNVKTDNSIPYSRFKEVNDTKTALQAELDRIKAQLKTDSEKKMAEEGKLKELNEQLSKERDDLLNYKTAVEAERELSRQALIKEFPEGVREKFKNYSLSQLNDIKSEFLKDTNKLSVDGSSPAEGQAMGFASIIDAANAHRRGEINPEEYGKVRKYFKDKFSRS